ncbi:hypothetical protein BDR07DRAFT_1479753 [Suillus spraguei]|nr:hypothetical protein BDR07DRAFT_1479753 [Suillus spraguei]
MPPAHHQCARHSARLKATTLLHLGAMDEESNNLTHLPSNLPLEQSGPRLTIQWHNDHALTDMLVNYLTTHPADCRILFYSDGKKAMAAADDGPSGSDKGQIYSVIAKLVFMEHIKYGPAYLVNPKKFRNAVCNRIRILRGKYKKIKASFGSTGAGVMPAEGTPAKNLLDAALLELPWYMELDAIWHSNPSMAAKVHSSRPGINHAGAFYSLVRPHGGAGPLMYYGPSQHSSHTPNVPDPPSAYQHGPHLLQDENMFAGGMYPPATHDYSQHSALPPALPLHLLAPPLLLHLLAHPLPLHLLAPPLPLHLLAPPLPLHLLAPPLPLHLPPYVPDVHLPGLLSDDDDDIANNNNNMMLGSPFPVTGKKHQLPSSPSPPPSPPKPFIMPSRTLASTYNNCSAFGIQKPSSHGGTSTPSSTTCNTTSSSEYHISLTPQTSLLNSTGSSKKKKAKSDMSQQVEQVRDEIESLHSSVMSCHEAKHQCYITKLESKSEHNCDVKKYDWLCATREHEVSKATVSHQRLQEAKDAEIRLHETDIWVNQAHSLVLDKEAETLRLKIQFHQMMQASKAASDEGTG